MFTANCNIKKGGVFTNNNIVAKRTGGKGISPIYYKDIIGKSTLIDIKENHILKFKEMD